jgi:ATP-dependent Lhr-like helicase
MMQTANGSNDPPQDPAPPFVLPEPLAGWFQRRFGEPTEVQRLAWPQVAAGRHVLIGAPTGTGKTLAAFLPILANLVSRGSVSAGTSRLSCLYLAPLKALGSDTWRTLSGHLEELADLLPAEVLPRLAVRTGDTPATERRRLLRDPPDILLTTPESLAVLLSQATWQPVFAGLRQVVVDEVHALASNKRGADLSLSLERLSLLAGEALQRIGLSATAAPLAEAGRWLSGVDRPCVLVRATAGAELQLTVAPLRNSGRLLASLVDHLLPELRASRSTIVFTNTRRLAEQLGWALRRNAPEWEGQIAVHHSALSSERRRTVEEDFKAGRLRAVVSSTSLELGIDIGPIDLAVLVHPPGDVVRLLQRVGRAGHGPGRLKRGLVLAANDSELLEATVTAGSCGGPAEQCEALRLPAAPLDVLCQQIAGLAAAQPSSADAVFKLVRRAAPYRDLSRQDFDDCLTYLLGQDREGQPWLPARLRGERDGFTIADARTTRLLRRNLGTILADPQYEVWHLEEEEGGEGRLIGQVDQAFAERLRPGERFLLDGRCLQVRRVEAEESVVWVEEVAGRPVVPRWGGEGWPLSAELAGRLYLLRMQAAEALREGPAALLDLLRQQYGLAEEAAAVLVDYFSRQESFSEVPDTAACLVEAVAQPWGADYYLHTPLSRPGNDALARVAVHRLARDRGLSAASIVADLGFALQVRGPLADPAPALRALLAPEGFERDLGAALAGSAAVRGRFRCVALTGLMLLRNPLGRRRRVGGGEWTQRRLFEQVQARDPQFVLLRQAEREVRSEVSDLAAALEFAQGLARRPLRCRWLPYPSPFVAAWTQEGEGAAETVESPADVLWRLHQTLTGGAGDDARPG